MKFSGPTTDMDYQLNIRDFDQDPKNGWRKFLPPPGADPGPTPEQFQQAGDSIKIYFEENRNRGVPPKEVSKWEFSLNFHAFQMYARCDDKEKMQYFLQKSIEQFKAMSLKDLKELKRDYGPTVQPYLEATLIFLGNKENKKQMLNDKLSEILKTPIIAYPDSNVVFFAGRVHDMTRYPNASYDEIFKHPTKLPPLPHKSSWVNAATPEEVHYYLKNYTAVLKKEDTSSSSHKSIFTPLKASHDPLNKQIKHKEAHSDMSVDVTAKEMAKSAFGQGSNTAKKIKNK